jgi:hypothetical protein
MSSPRFHRFPVTGGKRHGLCDDFMDSGWGDSPDRPALPGAGEPVRGDGGARR